MSVSTRYIAAPPDSSLPALVIQLTTLVDSCMIWIGITQEAEEMAEKVVESGRLGSDWACAMPSSDSSKDCPSVSLLRASHSDVAMSMAPRLARRFKKQIFLAVDIPPAFISAGQIPPIILHMEKQLVRILREIS
ncbi:hypothetical protein SISNIDRAFT_484886 [Sistotremastrum niveocremeum HHB9708]|uniref:Proteasome assembly chaperone 3 n=1 Tax=Sistotremastrum niveocremeum HHB9708 TaxID=1314777 RepID=A0A164V8J3_9AGAM|nr:hypothetical protein SISNIDRAFT_484886 [Sistotremastrum niveocremeum HHB9708]